MKKVQALAGMVILAISFVSFIPLQAARTTATQTVTVTSIIRVTTTINLTVTFVFQTQGTYRIPILIVNATLVAAGNGLTGVIAGQYLNFSITWGPGVSCITNSQGRLLLDVQYTATRRRQYHNRNVQWNNVLCALRCHESSLRRLETQ